MGGLNSVDYRINSKGFTLVEILIAVVVIAVLAGLSIVGYDGLQKRAATAAVIDDLVGATDTVRIQVVRDNGIYSGMDSSYSGSPEVTLVYIDTSTAGGIPYYGTLAPPENGKLLYDICQNLVDSGYGQGASDFGGGTVNYISGCHVYDTNYLQINGWNGGFNVSSPSVTEEMLQSYADTAHSSHPDHPTYGATVQNFMTSLAVRFKAQGGTFPVTNFWKPWVGVPALPAPTSFTKSESNYCIVATSNQYPDISYTTSSKNPTPKPGVGCS